MTWRTEENEPHDAELIGALRDALRPAPLPAALRDRVAARFSMSSAASSRSRVFHIGRWVATAVAACVAFEMFLPTPSSSDLTQPPQLTSDDAAAIVSALGLTHWESRSNKAAVSALEDSVLELNAELRGEHSSESASFHLEGDWDMPRGDGRDGAEGAWRLERWLSGYRVS